MPPIYVRSIVTDEGTEYSVQSSATLVPPIFGRFTVIGRGSTFCRTQPAPGAESLLQASKGQAMAEAASQCRATIPAAQDLEGTDADGVASETPEIGRGTEHKPTQTSATAVRGTLVGLKR